MILSPSWGWTWDWGYRDISDTGIKILDIGTNLVRDVVDKGVNVISEPIKIIMIAASVIGGIIILLIAYKYLHKEKSEQANINLATSLHLHPHIWKEYEKHHKKTSQQIDFSICRNNPTGNTNYPWPSC